MSKARIGWWRALFIERLPRFYRPHVLQAFTIAGDCLRPWLLPGDVVLADPTLDPVDGELVLVNMKYRRNGGITLGVGVTYRTEPAIKQLVLVEDAPPMLAFATGAVKTDHHDVVGPIVAVSRRGWRRAPLKDMDFSSNVPVGAAQAS